MADDAINPMVNLEDEELFERLSQYVRAQMAESATPGIAVGILESDGDRHTAGYGITNVNHPLEVTPQTLFQVGSVTKTITALVAMCFVDAGKLDLDTPLRKYWPHFILRDEATAQQVTMRDLLTHIGGWYGDFFIDTGEGDDALRVYAERVSELPQALPLRTAFSYNNAGFAIAGYVLEHISGKRYETLVKEYILDPLGMTHSFFRSSDQIMLQRFAVGHHRSPHSGMTVASPWSLPRGANPIGGLVCSVEDMLKYGAFMLGDGTTPHGTRIISEDTMQELRSQQVDIGGNEGRAIAWGYDDGQGVLRLSHGGGTNGQVCTLLFAPERKFVACVLTNSSTAAKENIVNWIQQEYLGLMIPEPAPLPAQPAPDEYVGIYSRRMMRIEIAVHAGQLQAQVTPLASFPAGTPVPPQTPWFDIAFHAEDEIVVTSGDGKGTTGLFLRDDAGTIYGFRTGGRINIREKI